MQLKLVKSDERLVQAEKALLDKDRLREQSETELTLSAALLESKELELARQAAQLAMSALEVVQKNKELRATDNSLAKRTEELEKRNRELNEMMRQREDFVAAITHDLKSPLLSATRILEYLVSGRIPAERQNLVFNQLLESNREMLLMIFNLLDVYRCDAGSIVAICEEVDIPSTIQYCVEPFDFSLKEKQLKLIVNVEDDVKTIEGDGLLIKRILTNLLSNAIKFSKMDGEVVVRAWRVGKRLMISVRDSGAGMSDEQKRCVFQRFWQTHKSRESGTGTGLGLYLSKELAATIGGELTFVSELDAGSEFTLSLPATP